MCAADFKSACKKAGIALIVIFVARCLADGAVYLIGLLMNGCNRQLVASLQSLASILILYVGAITVTAKALGYSFDKSVYNKPKRFGKAISWFVPAYGASQIANIAVLLISFVFASNSSAVQQTYEPMIHATQTVGAWYLAFLFIQMVVLAPIFEEYWFRGVIQGSLSQYGNGFAIVVSALCFGMAHGNIHQLCYCFIMGIVVGYVRYATGSILPTTIIHAMLNSISGIVIVAINTPLFTSAVIKLQKSVPLDDGEQALLVCLAIFLLIVLIVLGAGIAAAIGKLKNNRIYRPVNNYPTLSSKQKAGAVCKNPVFIIGFLLCAVYITAMIFI